MQKATCGRIVHFYEADDHFMERPKAGIVTLAYPDSMYVNIYCFPRDASDSEGLNEEIPFSEKPRAGHWSWPKLN